MKSSFSPLLSPLSHNQQHGMKDCVHLLCTWFAYRSYDWTGLAYQFWLDLAAMVVPAVKPLAQPPPRYHLQLSDWTPALTEEAYCLPVLVLLSRPCVWLAKLVSAVLR